MRDTPLLIARFYKTPAGNEPVREWLLSLPNDDRKSIGIDIKTVQFGWPMGMPLIEKIENGLWEVRSIGLSLGIARIIFTISENQMILLDGFIKKSRKIPQENLDLARKRLSNLRG
jgi:phage-related protein